MKPWKPFFKMLGAVLDAAPRGTPILVNPDLRDQLKQLAGAPIFSDERASEVLRKYETEIEDLLNHKRVSPHSDEVHDLMQKCLAELRGGV